MSESLSAPVAAPPMPMRRGASTLPVEGPVVPAVEPTTEPAAEPVSRDEESAADPAPVPVSGLGGVEDLDDVPVADEAHTPAAEPAAPVKVPDEVPGKALVILDGGAVRYADDGIVFVEVAGLADASAEALLALLQDLREVKGSTARTALADEITGALRRSVGV